MAPARKATPPGHRGAPPCTSTGCPPGRSMASRNRFCPRSSCVGVGLHVELQVDDWPATVVGSVDVGYRVVVAPMEIIAPVLDGEHIENWPVMVGTKSCVQLHSWFRQSAIVASRGDQRMCFSRTMSYGLTPTALWASLKPGCGSATIPPGDLTSPNQQTLPQVGPDSPLR